MISKALAFASMLVQIAQLRLYRSTSRFDCEKSVYMKKRRRLNITGRALFQPDIIKRKFSTKLVREWKKIKFQRTKGILTNPKTNFKVFENIEDNYPRNFVKKKDIISNKFIRNRKIRYVFRIESLFAFILTNLRIQVARFNFVFLSVLLEIVRR